MRFPSVKIHMCIVRLYKNVSIFHILLPLTVIECASAKVIQSPEFTIVSSPSNAVSDNVMETQHTNCRISSDQLIADAQATVTRVLIGGCNAKTINERFAKLERIFIIRTEEIRELIQSMINHNGQIDIIPQNNNEKLYSTSPRQYEVKRYNHTLQEILEFNGSRKLFTYFWQIAGIRKKLSDWETGRSERSNTFYINEADYAMFMKFTPKYFPDGTIFVSVGLTKGQRDDRLTWPFSLHLRIEILDHSPDHLRADRRSMMWNPSTMCPSYFWERPGINGSIDNPECVGLSMPRHILLSKNRYLFHGTITNYAENLGLIATYHENVSDSEQLFGFTLSNVKIYKFVIYVVVVEGNNLSH